MPNSNTERTENNYDDSCEFYREGEEYNDNSHAALNEDSTNITPSTFASTCPQSLCEENNEKDHEHSVVCSIKRPHCEEYDDDDDDNDNDQELHLISALFRQACIPLEISLGNKYPNRRIRHRQKRRRLQQQQQQHRRRPGLMRKKCQYGMDRVGEHVGTIQEWIELVHKNSFALDTESVRSSSDNNDLGSEQSLSHSDFTNGRDRNNNSEEVYHKVVADNIFPSNVTATAQLEDALIRLSLCLLDAYEKRSEIEYYSRDVERIIETIARIPSFMKTILLIKDAKHRDRILSMPIVRKVMLCPYSIMTQQAAYEVAMDKRRHRTTSQDQNEDRNSGSFGIRSSSSTNSAYTDESNCWLLEMIGTGKKPLADLALEYMEMISNLTVDKYLCTGHESDWFCGKSQYYYSLGGNKHTGKGLFLERPEEVATATAPISFGDESEFQSQKSNLYITFDNIHLFIPYLFTLSNKNIERASVTSLVQHVLTCGIKAPFSMFITFVELVLYIIVLVTWHCIMWTLIDSYKKNPNMTVDDYRDEIDTFGERISFTLAPAAFYYFFFRLAVDFVSMLRISWRVFWVNFLNFSHLVHTVAMIGALIMMMPGYYNADFPFLVDHYFVFGAIVTGLFWLDFIGFLQVLNRNMATVMLAILQILRDIVIFSFVLLIMLVAFAEMLYTITTVNQDVCPENFDSSDGESTNPFCTSRGLSYLATYRIIVGDVSVDDYMTSSLTVFLFVFLTFLGILIMLTVLIAIVDDSYTRASMKSAQLFGRARVAYIAKNIAFENFISPRPLHFHQRTYVLTNNNGAATARATMSRCPRMKICWWEAIRVFMRLNCVGISALVYYFSCEIMIIIVDEMKKSMSRGLAVAIGVTINIFILGILSILLTFLVTGWGKNRRKWKRINRIQDSACFNYVVVRPAFFITNLILGLKFSSEDSDEWSGRLNYITDSTKAIVSDLKNEMRTAIDLIEMRMEQIESERKKEMKDLKNRLDRLEKLIVASMNSKDLDHFSKQSR